MKETACPECLARDAAARLTLRSSAKDLYPCTVFPTRYGGAYERGAWAAVPEEIFDVDPDALGDDLSAGEFWGDDARSGLVGRGATPEEAVQDMLARRVAKLRETGGPLAPR